MLLLADQYFISPLNNCTSLASGSLNSSTDSKANICHYGRSRYQIRGGEDLCDSSDLFGEANFRYDGAGSCHPDGGRRMLPLRSVAKKHADHLCLEYSD